jgi:hypothetical protein
MLLWMRAHRGCTCGTTLVLGVSTAFRSWVPTEDLEDPLWVALYPGDVDTSYKATQKECRAAVLLGREAAGAAKVEKKLRATLEGYAAGWGAGEATWHGKRGDT